MSAEENVVQVAHIETMFQRIRTFTDAIDGKKFQNVTVSANGLQMQFWTSNDTTGTPAYTVDFPEEIFVDQLNTKFEPNFAFSTAIYPGATDPQLDGKPVFVLAVKGDKQVNPTSSYSFINLEGLIKTYTPANAGISIAGSSIGVQVSAGTGNLLSIANDGLFVGSDENKLDKDPTAIQGNVAAFGANGAVVDSGIAASLIDASNKMDKVPTAVTGNFATWNANGAVVDSGVTFATDADITAILNKYFPVGGASSAINGN